MDRRLYNSVPKDRLENIEYRLKLRRRADGDPKFQAAMMKACREDILFFLAAFCWLFEPRPTESVEPIILPFIPWDHQEGVVDKIDEVLGREDVVVEKSRGEGMTWIALMIFLHRWLFSQAMLSFGLVSRNLLMADNPEDPDSLTWKILWQLQKLPRWMVPDFRYIAGNHSIRSLDTNSTIVAYAATPDIARGGRKTAFLMDELASWKPPMTSRGADEQAMKATQAVTFCRLMVSTPQGPDGEYARIAHQRSAVVKLILDWRDNRTKNRGLYKVEKGKPVEVDPVKYGPLPQGYLDQWPTTKRDLEERGYSLENTVRSPWYDKECLRAGASPKLIAQELDRDYGGSVSRFFPAPLIDRLLAETARPEYLRGELVPGPRGRPKFKSDPEGRLRLWCNISSVSGLPPASRYVLGVDVAAGVGGEMSSNSVISVVDKSTGVKVAEFASPIVMPHRLADYAIMMASWFLGPEGQQAFLIWENGGPGSQFRARVFETDFRNYYHAQTIDESGKRATKKAGWNTTRKSKLSLLGRYLVALQEGKIVNHSKAALLECKQYVRGPDGLSVYHIGSEAPDDPAGAGESHGDRVIADALACWVVAEFTPKASRVTPSVIGSYVKGRHPGLDVPAGTPFERRIKAMKKTRKRHFWR